MSEPNKTPSTIQDDAGASKKEKDFWDKLDITTKPIAAFFTALVITIIGYYGQRTITEISLHEQSTTTRLALQEQNARLYTQLLASREASESALRKDMFKEILSGFFRKSDDDDIQNDLSKKVLKLELLAINFGDALSLGPLFSEMSQDIEKILRKNGDKVADWQTVAGAYQKRLRGLARRVASQQYSTIYPSGVPFDFEVPLNGIELSEEMASSDWNYEWPYDHESYQNNPDINVFVLDDIKRSFEISFRNADYAEKSVQVKLEIFEFKLVDDPAEDSQSIEQQEKVTDLEFTLDFFNFPLIDNTRLSNNQRFTLILEKFDTNTLKIAGMVFPGLYASQKDKPFLNEAIQELSQQRISQKRNMEKIDRESQLPIGKAEEQQKD